MAKLHKITLYVADQYPEDGDALSNLNGDLYHGDYSYRIDKVETVEVGGDYGDDHELNDYNMWNQGNDNRLSDYFIDRTDVEF